MSEVPRAPTAPSPSAFLARSAEILGTLGQELFGLLLGLFVGLSFAALVSTFGPDPEVDRRLLIAIGPLSMGVAGLVYWLVLDRALNAGAVPRHLPGTPMSWGRTAAWISGLALILVVGSTLVGALAGLLGWTVEEQKSVTEILTIRDGRLSAEAWVLIPAAVFGAPIVEEVLFRFLLFRRLLHTTRPAVAYLVSALAFGLVHNNPMGLPVYMLQGLIFAGVYAKTGRLGAAIAVHFLNNLITVGIALS